MKTALFSVACAAVFSYSPSLAGKLRQAAGIVPDPETSEDVADILNPDPSSEEDGTIPDEAKDVPPSQKAEDASLKSDAQRGLDADEGASDSDEDSEDSEALDVLLAELREHSDSGQAVDSGSGASGSGGAGRPLSVKAMKAELLKMDVAFSTVNGFKDRESLEAFLMRRRRVVAAKAARAQSGGSAEAPAPSSGGGGEAKPDRPIPWEPPKGLPPRAPPRAPTERARPALSQVVLLGEPHSGLSWTSELVALNCPTWVVAEPLRRDALVASPESLDFAGANRTLLLLVALPLGIFPWALSLAATEAQERPRGCRHSP